MGSAAMRGQCSSCQLARSRHASRRLNVLLTAGPPRLHEEPRHREQSGDPQLAKQHTTLALAYCHSSAWSKVLANTQCRACHWQHEDLFRNHKLKNQEKLSGTKIRRAAPARIGRQHVCAELPKVQVRRQARHRARVRKLPRGLVAREPRVQEHAHLAQRALHSAPTGYSACKKVWRAKPSKSAYLSCHTMVHHAAPCSHAPHFLTDSQSVEGKALKQTPAEGRTASLMSQAPRMPAAQSTMLPSARVGMGASASSSSARPCGAASATGTRCGAGCGFGGAGRRSHALCIHDKLNTGLRV